ncbi:MAG TPA: hypothetical protein VHY91_07635 [Pirellulales bacterium]|jgi:hypothetical protein|nr:hypothetical protein [Pirellulales bacterium]
MDEKLLAALVGCAGALVGLFVRDVVIQLYLFNRKRRFEREDRQSEEGRESTGAVWQYAAPLYRSIEALHYRLKEVIDDGPATYLLLGAPKTDYFEYKRISTVYRLAAVLGWIRGYRKERSYLDPTRDSAQSDVERAIAAVESALADGQHVEAQRLQELVKLWSVPADRVSDLAAQRRIAAELDVLHRDFLANADKRSLSELDDAQQITVCKRCAALIAERLKVAIPEHLVSAEVKRAVIYLDIKEAYIYRDWQAAIGDLMLTAISNASRRFDVIGYGDFEARYLAARELPSSTDRLWLDRLESLVLGLDMRVAGIFDARREQVRRLQQAAIALKDILAKRLEDRKRE